MIIKRHSPPNVAPIQIKPFNECINHCRSLSFLLAASTRAQITEQKAIGHVKQLSPSILDSTLPDGHFAGWLACVVGKDAVVEWELNDCGEKDVTPLGFLLFG